MSPTTSRTRRTPGTVAMAALMAMVGAVAGFPSDAAAAGMEERIQAAYAHVLRNVDWPDLPGNTIRLCLLGTDEITGILRGLSGRQVGGRTVAVDTAAEFDPAHCQALFIGRSEKRWPRLLERLRGVSVLTTSDVDGFARAGGVVGFYPLEDRIRLEVNVAAARASSLRISASLLELARDSAPPTAPWNF